MKSISRRRMLAVVGTGLVASVYQRDMPLFAGQGDESFSLPPLPYPNDALEAAIDAKTMEIHHDRHHAAYVTGLNNAVKDHSNLKKMSVDDLLRNIKQVPEGIRQAVINHGGGHSNHSLFWQIMGPKGGGSPAGPLAEAINSTFSNFDNFKNQFRTAALGRFGSGWSWLVWSDHKLQITHTANQDSPLMSGQTPILGLDVWEHAYYLRYQNRRADYVDAWWKVVNWESVGSRFNKLRG